MLRAILNFVRRRRAERALDEELQASLELLPDRVTSGPD
jgi:hypothetical protein